MNDSRQPEAQPPSAEDLERRLQELLPSLRIVDQDLELDGAPVADLVGEADGRIVLVLFVDGEGDGPMLAALDALSVARRDGDLLAAHLGLTTLSGKPPLVLLVAERFGERLRERAGAVPADRLWLVERRSLRTARRDVWPLVRRAASVQRELGQTPEPEPARSAATPSARAPRARPADRFLAQLPAGAARVARELIERIGRVDPELELQLDDWNGGPEFTCQGLTWSFRGRALCGLTATEGRLQGRLPGSPVPHAIQGPGTIDTFLDWVLTCHLELLDGRPERDERDEHDELGEVELVPSRREPLLTPEEIDAFRD